MKTLRNILMLLTLTSFLKANGQTFDKTFSGQWGMTFWKYEFYKNGTFKRTSSGHFGNRIYTGTYFIKSDTIQIIKGFEKTSGTLNEYYLLDKDSMLIDLVNFYDYSPNKRDWEYISKKRYDILKKPNVDSLIVVNRQEFDTIVQNCIAILNTHRNIEIKDADHITIIRVINTINMSQGTSFKNGIYADFMKLVKDKDYEKEISIYYDWIPNRGMGFYFQKLQVELGGTPHLYSRYTIK